MTILAEQPRTEHKRLLPEGTYMGTVHLAVTDRDAALTVWRDIVGLTLLTETGDELHLGAGSSELIVLHTGASAPVKPNSLGLYHVALHVPNRADLAYFIARASQAGLRVSPTDHLVTEAVYAWDTDGNGIEMTFETPDRGTLGDPDEIGAYGLTKDGRPHSGREPIDLNDLMGEIAGAGFIAPSLPEGTRVGHVHVHVDSLEKAMAFYRDVIGFEGQFLWPRWGMGDVRLAYEPHAMAFNIWSGRQAQQPEPGRAGLRWFAIMIPNEQALKEVEGRLSDVGAETTPVAGGLETKDPAGNRLRLLIG